MNNKKQKDNLTIKVQKLATWFGDLIGLTKLYNWMDKKINKK